MRSPLFPALVAASLLMGCSFDALVDKIDPYRIDVRQGNYVDQKMVGQLRKGMTRDQVRFVLGSPLVVNAFRSDRWDYVYLYKPGDGQPQQRVISVFFDGELLDHVEGDVRGGDVAAQAGEDQAARSRVVEIPPAAAD
jgi:outer membrane protein assembly factor BamE